MAIGLDLDQYHFKKRVLLVFAPSPRDVRYEEQRTYLEDESGETRRWKITLFGVFEEGPSFAEDRPISHEDSVRARDEWGVEPGSFELHFLDLDGTEILRSENPLPVDMLIDIIPEE